MVKPRLEQLGRYVIVAELGQGAMGTVYKAIDPLLDRTVALKTVNLDQVTQDKLDFQRRFEREAKSTGRLNHPNIVIVHDYGEVDGIAYIAMEFLAGKTLRALLEGGKKLPIAEAVRCAAEVADALASAHAQSVIHRDIKPSNIVRLDADGKIKLTDFGIALMPNLDLTQAGTVLGTPKYMSPEQVRGLRVDGRSDIFSLGAVLYEMLTGTTPFDGTSLTAIMFQVISAHPIHPAKRAPEIPDALAVILSKCLAKNPAARYQDAAELARDLRNYKTLNFAPGSGVTAFSSNAPANGAGSTATTKPARSSARRGQEREAARSRRAAREAERRAFAQTVSLTKPETQASNGRGWRKLAALIETQPATAGMFALGIAVLVVSVAIVTLRNAHPTQTPTAATETPRPEMAPAAATPPPVDSTAAIAAQASPAAISPVTGPDAGSTPASDARPGALPQATNSSPASDRPTAELGMRANRGKATSAGSTAKPVNGVASAQQTTATPAAAAPNKRDDAGKSFWQRQKECITQNKCDPPTSTRDSMN